MKNIIANYKVNKQAENVESVEVLNVPESLAELQERFSESEIIDFIVKQVLAHSCFSACRSYFKDKGKPLAQWGFTLPQKRQESASKKATQELDFLAGLGITADTIKSLDTKKLAKLAQLLK